MSNNAPGTAWTKFTGYIGGFNANNTGAFELGTKYWTPMALFNYSGGGTSYISGWKVIKINREGPLIVDLPAVSQVVGVTSSLARTLTVKVNNQPQINFGSYSGSWSPAIQLQNNDNTRLVWIGSLDSANLPRIRTGGAGLDIFTNGTISDGGVHSARIESGSVRSPIFFDLNNTGYYVDPNSTTALRTVGSWRADSSSWDGEFSGKMQYHANHWYIQAADLFIYRNAPGSNVFTINQSGVAIATGDMRAPIFYDNNDTAFYVDPNADLAVRVFGEIANSNYQQGAMQPGALNIGRTDRDYGWDGTSWAGDIRSGILANCSELWEFNLHDSGDSVHSVFRYNGGNQLLMGRNIGWGTCFIEAAQDFRAPIFFDSNNTAYFVDPNSTSNLSTVRMDGNLTINNSSPTIFLQDTDHQTSMIHCNSNIFYVLRGNVNSTSWNILNGRWPLEINLNSGDFVTGGAINARTEVTAFGSDFRLKENIRNIDNALSKVMQLNGVYYDWKDMVEDVGFFPSRRKNEAGVIAQEVEKVLPQAVAFAPFDREWVKGEDGGATSETYSISGENYLTVKYEKLVPLLIEAIKEQQTTIDSLSKKVEELTNLVQNLINKSN
jgi:hypothetical protein